MESKKKRLTSKDIIGHRFGRLVALSYAGDGKYLCQCDCGNKKLIATYSLTSGATQSCGCLRREVTSKTMMKYDLTGQTFGEWTVIAHHGSGSLWLCRCSCGKEKLIAASHLLSGITKSCGHNTTGFKDLTGQKFGRLTVISYNGHRSWHCKCDCGRETDVVTDNLINGRTTSCGHHLKNKDQFIDISGRTFGYLTAIKYVGGNKWLCKCVCGNYTIKDSQHLRRSDTISCGCKEPKKWTEDEIIEKINEYIKINGERPYRYDLCSLLNLSHTSVERWIQRYNLYEYIGSTYRSRYEEEINKMFPTNFVNDRHEIPGYELDLYYPEQRVAIEFNGNLWHSDRYKDKNYHKNKAITCGKNNIKLISIFEYEWEDPNKKSKIINLIKRELNIDKPNIIYGRKTYIHTIDSDTAKNFLELYHIAGNATSSIQVGMFFDNELIGVITLGKPRFNNKYEYEIIRLCWKDNTAVIGGTNKLIRYVIKKYNIKSLITYADLSKFNGMSYKKFGFKVDGITDPNYIWWTSNGNEVLTRYQTQKHKLIQLGLGKADETEEEIMTKMGYNKIYDCGNMRYTWIRNN